MDDQTHQISNALKDKTRLHQLQLFVVAVWTRAYLINEVSSENLIKKVQRHVTEYDIVLLTKNNFMSHWQIMG